MKSFQVKAVIAVLMMLVLVLYPNTAFAISVPIRHGSDVGQSSNAVNWNLYGPSQLFLDGQISTNQEVICPGQDVAAAANDNTNSGGCSSGNYLFVFQFTSANTNVVFTLSHLKGFTFNDNPSSPDTSTVGVLECDANGNTTGLCTTLAASGPAASFPAITFTHPTNNTSVSFHIPSIPAYPAGTGTEGQGLTVFIQTHLATPIPLVIPKPN